MPDAKKPKAKAVKAPKAPKASEVKPPKVVIPPGLSADEMKEARKALPYVVRAAPNPGGLIEF